MKILFTALLALLVFSFVSFASTPVTGCMNIASPGDYQLSNDMLGAGTPATSAGGTACIRISSSDVSLDCAGHILTGESARQTYGILVESPANSPVSNIHINNCTITNFDVGIFTPTQTSSSSFTNLNLSNNVAYGLNVWALSRSTIANNTASRNGDTGLYVALGSNNNQILNNTVVFNDHHGLAVSGNGNTISGTLSQDNRGAGIFIISPSSGNTVTTNTAYRNSGSGLGFELNGESQNTVLLNVDYGNRDPNAGGSSGVDTGPIQIPNSNTSSKGGICGLPIGFLGLILLSGFILSRNK